VQIKDVPEQTHAVLRQRCTLELLPDPSGEVPGDVPGEGPPGTS